MKYIKNKTLRQIENPTPSIYLKKNPAKFYPDPIWNDGAFRFFEEHHPKLQQQQQQQQQQ